jgi:RNA polymerase sigma-70 factor (ECF subfamily)
MDGTRPGYDEFFRTEYPSVVRTVLPIVGELADAEAVTQDAFLKAVIRWGRIRRYDRPGAWVRRVAIRDAVRLAERRPPAVEPGSAADPMDAVAGRMDLHRALTLVTTRQRASLTLHYLAGWPVAEVAAALGCSEATVRVHLHRGRAALGTLLSDDPQELHDGC